MKWFKISEVAHQSQLTAKALRLYEAKGLLIPDCISEKRYRLYSQASLDKAVEIKKLKNLGFSLTEIKQVLSCFKANTIDELKSLIQGRINAIESQQQVLANQHFILNNIMTSINDKSIITEKEKRYIMTKLKQVSIVFIGESKNEQLLRDVKSLTGFKEIEPKSKLVAQAKQAVTFISWSEFVGLKFTIQPDTVVFTAPYKGELKDLEQPLAQLYKYIGPHVSTVFNADDAFFVELAGHSLIRKGRIFYYSKNTILAQQIQNIGGVVQEKDSLKIYGFNMNSKVLSYDIKKAPYDKLRTLGAVIDIGLNEDKLNEFIKYNI